MNTYIVIIGTFLAICEIIRVIQNRINLWQQRKIFEASCGDLSEVTEKEVKLLRQVKI